MVGLEGLEPSRLSTVDFKSTLATNYSITPSGAQGETRTLTGVTPLASKTSMSTIPSPAHMVPRGGFAPTEAEAPDLQSGGLDYFPNVA